MTESIKGVSRGPYRGNNEVSNAAQAVSIMNPQVIWHIDAMSYLDEETERRVVFREDAKGVNFNHISDGGESIVDVI